MITSLYENNFPVRFGVILYSSDLTRKIEMSGTELNGVEGIISQEEEELSSLVFVSSSTLFLLSLKIFFRIPNIFSAFSAH